MRAVKVSQGVDAAFQLFTHRLSDWWPPGRDGAALSLEPRLGGHWLARSRTGQEVIGVITDWQPPHRLTIVCRRTSRRRTELSLLNQLDVEFVAVDGGCEVVMRHQDIFDAPDDQTRPAQDPRLWAPGRGDREAATGVAPQL